MSSLPHRGSPGTQAPGRETDLEAPAGSNHPDFNADEAIWGRARKDATANQWLGNRAAVQEGAINSIAGLPDRKDEVKRRCWAVQQSKAEALLWHTRPNSQQMHISPRLWFGGSRGKLTNFRISEGWQSRVQRLRGHWLPCAHHRLQLGSRPSRKDLTWTIFGDERRST